MVIRHEWNNWKKLDILSMSLLILLKIELFATEVRACSSLHVNFVFNVMQFTLLFIRSFFFWLGNDHHSFLILLFGFQFPEFES